MLRSTFPNHLYHPHDASRLWMPSFKRRESELTSSLALILQIQRIIAWSLRGRPFNVAAVMTHVSATCSITLLTHVKYTLPLFTRRRLWSVRRESSWQNWPNHICSVLQHPARNHHQHKACPLDRKSLETASSFSLSTFTSFTLLPSIGRAVPRHQAHLKSGSGRKGPLDAIAFLPIQHKQPPHCYLLLSDRHRRVFFQISSTVPNPSQRP